MNTAVAWSAAVNAIRGAVIVVAVGIAAVASLGTAEAGSHGPASGPVTQPMPTDEFERRVRAYILKNPDVILEALQLIERREQATQGDEIKQVIVARRDEIFHDAGAPVGGNPNGDVTVVEFFDYNCPYCRRVAPMLIEAEKTDPGLRFVYKEWPILGPNSTFAARAALASVRQGKYVAFHKAMMQASGLVNEGKVMEIAKAVGLDVARLKKETDDPEIKAMIERNHALAAALRITGTPSFVIGDLVVRGAVDSDTFKSLVKEARERK